MKKNQIDIYTHKRIVLIPACCVLVVFIVALTLLSIYITKMKKAFYLDTNTYLTEINNQIANTIDERIDKKIHFIETLASTIKSTQDFSSATTRQIVTKEKITLEFSDIYFIPPTGEINISNKQFNISNNSFFQSALKGNTTISTVEFAPISYKPILIYACPVMVENNILGVIVATQDISSLRRLMQVQNFNSEGFTRIVNTDGTYIISTEKTTLNKSKPSTTLKDDISKIWDSYTNAVSEIEEIREKKKSGTYIYKDDSTTSTLIYSPLKYNDWYLFSIVPSYILPKRTTTFVHLTIFICVTVGTLLLVFIIFFSLLQVHNQKQLQNLAYIDPLTQNGNQNWFTKKAIELIANNPSTKYAIVSIDIEHFKIINDRFGRDSGDRALKEIYKWLCINLESGEIACRSLSDNFKLLIKYHNDQLCEERLKKISKDINAYNDQKKDDEKFFIRLICGVCPVEETIEKSTIDSQKYNLLACYDRAAVAMKTTKPIKDYYLKIGFFNEDYLTILRSQKIIENRMKSALQNNEFHVYFQPKYNIKQDKIAGAEALVRWADPTRGLIPPDEFIPLFENNGFILNLDLYVFEQTCHVLRQWLDNKITPVTISVNLSRAYISDFGFLGQFEQIRQKYDVPSKYIELELTETVVFENMTILTDIINLIHDLGYTCSIDDFGSGYSSLNILKSIPVDTIKLDKAFFCGENSDTLKSDNIVKSVIDLAKKLNMKTVSEGIEYDDQVQFLKNTDCDMIQGFYYSRPIPISDFEKLAYGLVISEKRSLPFSQQDNILEPEEFYESDQKFSESNFPATVILKKKNPKV